MPAAPDRDGLRRWYAAVRRPLPWRLTRDPYALLVSEVMLQQTQAARVVPYYEAFLARFPDPAALAAAPVREVLAAWSGLGYNRRAVALREAARVVAENGWPADLTELPGVGPYTAAAVAAFAWDRRVAAVDTNVRRVIERWDGERRTPAALARRASEWLDRDRPADFNQAMMELGATVCGARTSQCEACPLSAGCSTAAAGGPAIVPRSPAKSRPRFEDTDRWARGRVLASLLEREPLPGALGGERLERVIAGLERDGLVVRGTGGEPRLP